MINNETYRFGSAEWPKKDDFERAGMFEKRGLQIGYAYGKALRLDTDAPFLTIAGAGSGKMRDLLALAIALNAGNRNFVLDPRGEIASVTMLNFTIAGSYAYCWNPTSMNRLPQHRVNPLDILRIDSPRFHADTKFIASSLIPTSHSSTGRYFELRAADWGENILKMLVERDGYVSFPSFYRVINAIESDTAYWSACLEFMLKSSMDSVRRTAGEMLAKQQESGREFGSIVGELYAYLSFLDDPMLQAALERPDASLADTCNPHQAASWFINVPIEYVQLWAPLLRTMFTVQMLYKSRVPSAPRLTMIIDEAGQLGAFDSLLRAYTFGRGAGIHPWALFQDVGQVTKNFGPQGLQGFMGSSALRQFFGVRDYQTAQLASNMLGHETLEYDETLKQAEARRRKFNAAMKVMGGDNPFSAIQEMKYYEQASHHRSKQARALMTPDEILAMPEDKQLVFISGKNLRPALVEKYPYYQRREYAGRFLPNPFHPPIDSMPIPRWWGTQRAKVVTEPVPRQFAHLPQYQSGMWSYVDGFRPS